MTRIRSLAASALALTGLAVSAALLVDSLRAAPTFCAEGGCAEVRATAWAHPLGIPMPLVGIAFFLLALALAAAGPRAHRARRAVALAGAAGAVGLLAIQGLAIGAWCRLCVVTDVAAILYAAVAVVAARPWPRAGGARIALMVAAAVAAVAVPLTSMRESGRRTVAALGLPDVVAREQVAGTAVVVDFVDFECPFCRAFHGRLTEALATAAVPVRVVRKMVPLRQHRGAMPAAIAWCCADAQGKGDEMADRLFAATDLTPAGLEQLAVDLGLDLDRFRADAADPATRARVRADAEAADAAGVRSLPTVYIGRQVFVGAAAGTGELVAALRRAASS